MAGIELRGVSKRYPDGQEAVKRMDLEVESGEFMILVGPSGCGKSTALRMLAGLEEVSEGEVWVDGRDVRYLPPKERDVAMVFQNYALYPHMTVRDNMAFALRMRRMARGEVRRRVDEAARMLDLEAHLDRKPAKLSGGQRQRVAMGRAIVREPKAFLMDEPLSNLDAKLRDEMRVAIARLQRRLGTTTVYVTHDQTEAMTLGDRVAVLRDGVLQQVDEPRVLYARPANVFVAGFIGSPPMNLFDGRIEDGAVWTTLGRLPLGAAARNALESRDVVVGVRAEDLVDARWGIGDVVVDVPVELAEPAGADTFVYFPLSQHGTGGDDGLGSQGVARLSGGADVRAGQHLRLSVDPGKLHLFDRASGLSLAAA